MEPTVMQFKHIIKRNGRKVKFDIDKITLAIEKAGKETGEFDEKVAKKLSLRVLSLTHETIKDHIPMVEKIQDLVEEVLLSSSYKQTAKAYIIYREQHRQIREQAEKMTIDLVDGYLENTNWRVKENSNMTYALQGLNNHIASEVSKVYWLNKIYPQKIKQHHIDGDLHIHDLSILSTYCVGWDLYDLLQVGFTGVRGKIESKPAKHFRSALGQVVNFFYTLQGESAGAQAFSNFDTLLAPFIRYDKLTFSEIKQALQEFMFNMNVPTRVGFQTPFTNVTIDLDVPSYYKDQGVLIGGEIQKEKYGDFQNELDTFNKALLEVMLEGDATGRVFSFPIPTYNITKDFNWDNPKLDNLWKLTAKYGVPYFANFVNSEMKPEDARSMCCRLRLDNRELRKRGGSLFGSSPLTGSIGVVTINMPRLGYLSENEKDFFAKLEELMDVAKDSLEIKRKVLEKYTENNLYPYVRFYLRNMKQKTGQYWKNHFSTIGLLGMNEALLNLMQKNIASPEGQEFAKKTLDFMREKIKGYQLQTGNLYNLEATPGEGTTYRFARIDEKKYPEIIAANGVKKERNGAAPFYTNSTHLPVNHTEDAFEALKLQDPLQIKYTGGTVLHLFLGEKIHDSEAVKTLIKKTFHDFELPYITLTPTFSVCQNCGYIEGEHHECPKCGNSCEVYSRVVGFLRPVDQWNNGKREEFKMRKVYKYS